MYSFRDVLELLVEFLSNMPLRESAAAGVRKKLDRVNEKLAKAKPVAFGSCFACSATDVVLYDVFEELLRGASSAGVPVSSVPVYTCPDCTRLVYTYLAYKPNISTFMGNYRVVCIGSDGVKYPTDPESVAEQFFSLDRTMLFACNLPPISRQKAVSTAQLSVVSMLRTALSAPAPGIITVNLYTEHKAFVQVPVHAGLLERALAALTPDRAPASAFNTNESLTHRYSTLFRTARDALSDVEGDWLTRFAARRVVPAVAAGLVMQAVERAAVENQAKNKSK